MGAAAVVLTAVAGAAWLGLLARVGLVAARMFQLEEYEPRRLLAWGSTRPWLAHRATVAAGVTAAAATIAAVSGAAGPAPRPLVASGWFAGLLLGHLGWRWLPPQKELVYTPRLRRLLASAALIATLLGLAACALVLRAPPGVAGAVAAAVSLAIPALSMSLLIAARMVNAPAEARVRRGFLRRAQQRLERFQPLVIAVAGSYGKTSTKHILAHMLECYGPTLPTPKSFNTLMGVSRTVNDVLEARHRTFVVEMDAYAQGEIAAICALVRPRHAVLTSVGPQHLERFGTMDSIGAALYETIDALPADGFAVVYGGDDNSAALAARARAEGHTVVTYGIHDEAGPGLDVVAENVRITGRGSHFTWCWDAAALRHDVVVPLLGRHQVLNVSAALATVHSLGMALQPALNSIAALRPVDHRLQPVPTGNAITVIDDSYNANPVGVHNGLEVLAAMEARTRILVTPGLVELGSVEEAENRRYGAHAAQVCDHVIVMEARPARALRDGLRAAGMPDDHVHVVGSLREATAVIGRIAGAGDAVLFANDLPDTYLGAA